MLCRYFVTGFSSRFGCWMREVIEAKSMEAAKQKFTHQHPGLKQIKAYTLNS